MEPLALKEMVVCPLLNKTSLDPEMLNSYCSVTKTHFGGKLLEGGGDPIVSMLGGRGLS